MPRRHTSKTIELHPAITVNHGGSDTSNHLDTVEMKYTPTSITKLHMIFFTFISTAISLSHHMNATKKQTNHTMKNATNIIPIIIL